MSELKQSLFSGIVISSILGSTEGTYYESDGGTITDIRTTPGVSTGNSGLSFGLTQLDVANNSAARAFFEQLVEDAYNNSRIDESTRSSFVSKAENNGTWTTSDLSTIQTQVLEPGKDQIEQKDLERVSEVTNIVDMAIDAAKAYWGAAGVFDPTGSDYYLAIGQLASWANRTGSLNDMQTWLTGGTVPGLSIDTLDHPPTIDDINYYLEHQSEFVNHPGEFDNVTENILRGQNLLPALMAPPGINSLYPDLDPFWDLPSYYNVSLTTMNSQIAWHWDPLVIDLDHDGIETRDTATSQIYFDYDGDGIANNTTWAYQQDGVLVHDLNADGNITGNELFGNNTATGFAALSALDSNHDNVINSSDTAFSDLQVWQDINKDGVSQADELHTLTDLGIVSISLTTRDIASGDVNTSSTGAIFSKFATVTWADTSTSVIGDVTFTMEGQNTRYTGDYDLDVRALFLPDLRGYAQMPSLHVALSLDNDESDSASLMAKAISIASHELAGLFSDWAAVKADFTDLLYRWAGVENASPTGRGAYVDGQELGFVEAFLGTPFFDRNEHTSTPGAVQGAEMHQVFEDIAYHLMGGFLMQTVAAGLLQTGAAYDAASDSITGTVSLSQDALDALSDAAAGLADTAARSVFWEGVAEFLHGVALASGGSGDFGLDSSEQTALNTAIQDSDAGLVWYAADHDPTHGLTSIEYRFDNPLGDTINGTSGTDTLTGTSHEDTISGLAGADTLNGGGGNDTLYGHSQSGSGDDNAADTLNGGDGDDTLYGGGGADILNGGNGNDHLLGGDGNDTLNGGAAPVGITEQNLMEGGAGDDLYIANASGGSGTGVGFTLDYIVDTGGTNKLQLPSFISSLSDLHISRIGEAGMSLTAAKSGLSMFVTIDGQFLDPALDQGIDTLKFTSTTFSSNIDLRDYLANYTNPIVTNGSDFDEVLHGLTFGTLKDEIHGAGGNDTIYGDEGDDALYGDNGNDILDGGAGNDTLTGGSGDDRFILSAGHDTISDSSGNDTVVFGSGITLEDLSIYQDSHFNLVISLDANTSIAAINNFEHDANKIADGGIENLEFSDGTIVTFKSIEVETHGTEGADNLTGIPSYDATTADVMYGYGGNDTIGGAEGNDTLYGGDGNDTLYGGNGNDSLYGGDGNDTLNSEGGSTVLRSNYLDGGAGNDTMNGGSGSEVYEFSTGQDNITDIGGHDYIHVNDYELSDLTFTRSVDGTLTISVASGDSVQINNEFNTTFAIEGLLFGPDNIEVGINEINFILTGTEGDDHLSGAGSIGGPDDTIYGLGGVDVITPGDGNNTVYAGDGNDTVTSGTGQDLIYGGNGNDTVNSDGGNDTVYGDDGNDTLSTGDGDDTAYGGAGTDTLNGGNGNDHLYGGDGNDTLNSNAGSTTIMSSYLDGGAGDDNLNGGSGSEVYEFSSGHDTINDTGGHDYLHFADYDLADLTFTRSGNFDLIVSVASGDSVRIVGEFVSNTGVEGMLFGPDNFEVGFNEVDYTLTGTSGNDMLNGVQVVGGINDTIYGLAGNDTINAFNGNNTVYGGDGNDTITTGTGTDYIDGGNGNDTITAGTGSDTILYNAGLDQVTDTGGTDVLWITGGVTINDISIANLSTANAKLTLNAGTDELTIVNLRGTSANQIETIQFDDGFSTSLANYNSWTTGTTSDDTLSGGSGNDTIIGKDGVDTISGNAGNDNIHGGAGNDVINGNDGADHLWGGTGNDTINGGNGDDVINGGSGTDTADYSDAGSAVTVSLATTSAQNTGGAGIDTLSGIENLTGSAYGDTLTGDGYGNFLSGGAGNDALNGSTGNDTLVGGAGNDTLSGGAGNDTYVYQAGDGQDVISDAGGLDAIQLGSGLAYDDLIFSRTGNDLTIDTDGTGQNTITITNFFVDETSRVETLLFDDLSTFDLTTLLNHAPVAADDSFSINEDTGLSGNLFDDNGNGADSDEDGDTLSADAASFTTAHGASVIISADGDFTYTPATNYHGTDSFEYTVADPSGETDTGTVNVTVNSINDTPVAAADSFTTDEDTALSSGNVTTNDTDADGDSLSATAGTFATAHGGSVTLHTDGTFTYAPAGNFNGSDSFNYTLSDGTASTTGTATVTVNAINDAPVAVSDNFTTNEDTALSSGNVIINDSDADGNSLSVTSGTFATAHGGTVVLNTDGTFTYTPAANFNGSDSFDYTLSDGTATVTGTAGISVASVNDAPVAQDDSFSFNYGSAMSGSLLTDHGSGADSDPDGDSLSVTAASFTTAGGASVVISSDGTFSYKPLENYLGSDSFTYTLNDTHGGTDLGSVSLAVVAGTGAIVGTSGANTLNGSSSNDILLGLAGNDVLNGNGGNDTEYGGSGTDGLNGNDGNDSLYGGSGADALNGGNDNDTLVGGIGTDTIHGDAGTDTAVWDVDSTGFVIYRDTAGYVVVKDTNDMSANGYGADKIYDDVESIQFHDVTVDLTTTTFTLGGEGWGTATFYGTSGGDTINGTAARDIIYGQAGLDSLSGFQGNDDLYGGDGNDGISGGDGNDLLTGDAGTDSLTGGNGNDTLIGGLGTDTIHGDAGTDTAVWDVDSTGFIIYRDTAGYVVVKDTNDASANGYGTGKVYDDVESIQFHDMTFDMTTTTFTLGGEGWGTAATLHGSTGGDAINGTAARDIIYGEAGSDSLSGFQGNDDLYGGDGNDGISGGDGNDLLTGDAGTDSLAGGNGNDTLIGGLGTDTIHGDAGTDTAIWNVNSAGFIIYRDTAGYVVVKDTNDTSANGYGTDKVYDDVETVQFNDITFDMTTTTFTLGGEGWGTAATLHGTTGGDAINGSAARDIIYGDAGNDSLSGFQGNDDLYGDAGNDGISGGDGNDVIYGGTGTDTLSGNAGADTFVFKSGDTGSDTINDFSTSEGDKLDISNVLTTYDPLTSAIGDFVHVSASGSNATVSVDANGTAGGANFVQIATLTGDSALAGHEDDLLANGNLIAAVA